MIGGKKCEARCGPGLPYTWNLKIDPETKAKISSVDIDSLSNRVIGYECDTHNNCLFFNSFDDLLVFVEALNNTCFKKGAENLLLEWLLCNPHIPQVEKDIIRRGMLVVTDLPKLRRETPEQEGFIRMCNSRISTALKKTDLIEWSLIEGAEQELTTLFAVRFLTKEEITLEKHEVRMFIESAKTVEQLKWIDNVFKFE